MDLNVNIYNLLIAFGTLQAFIFAITLCWKSTLKEAQFYLGITVLCLSLYLFWVLKYDFGLQVNYPKLQFLPVLFIWGIGPAFYAYLRFLFKQPLTSRALKLLFLPLLVEIVYFNSCTLLVWINDWKVSTLPSFQKALVYYVFSIEHIIGLIIIAIYLVKCFKLLKTAGVLYATNKIRSILICFGLLWLIWVPYTIVDVIYYNFGFPPSEFYLFYILFALLTYAVGFYGFQINNKTFLNVALTTNPQNLSDDLDSDALISNEMHALSNKIIMTMEHEKCYLNPDLNLASFSKEVNMHPNKVSAIINTVIGFSFRDFVNQYRVNEFKLQSESYDFKSKTILSLAYDSGFNSKASFNRAFKKFNDISPAEYLNRMA